MGLGGSIEYGVWWTGRGRYGGAGVIFGNFYGGKGGGN